MTLGRDRRKAEDAIWMAGSTTYDAVVLDADEPGNASAISHLSFIFPWEHRERCAS